MYEVIKSDDVKAVIKHTQPWNELEVGQGFVIEHRPFGSVKCSCYQKSVDTGKKFRAKKIDNGVLVTRIA